jgi:hypothetical protein
MFVAFVSIKYRSSVGTAFFDKILCRSYGTQKSLLFNIYKHSVPTELRSVFIIGKMSIKISHQTFYFHS